MTDVETHFLKSGMQGFAKRKPLFDSLICCQILTLCLAFWWLALVLHGDGMETDTTRRHHPIWETYLSLPIAQSAAFFAEALTPIMTAPNYWAAPIVIAGVAGFASESFIVGLFALPLGIPLVIAAAVWTKAMEVQVMLRSSPRNRGALFVLLSGTGALFWFTPLIMTQFPKASFSIVTWLSPWLSYLPRARWLVQADTPLHWLRALVANVAVAGGLCTFGAWAMRRAASQGLEQGFGAPETVQAKSAFATAGKHGEKPARWWLDPLFRKELLWLKRDRGALIQILLVPLALIAANVFNFSNMLRHFEMNWHRAAGLVMIFGAYLLFLAGPRALVSEASALTFTLSWPRALEDTLRMKVRMLFAVISAVVLICLIAVVLMFPADWFKVLAVGLIWPIFGLSVVEKSITLITSPSSSGEPEPLPQATRMAASLGNLSFGIGLFMGSWQIAIMGLALNWVLAGALWQSFRARLPFLFDPHSQPKVLPPTILSSVIAILGMQELGIIVSIPFMVMLGKDGTGFAMLIGYGLAGILVCLFVHLHHLKHGVELSEILNIDALPANRTENPKMLASLTLAALIAVCLSMLAIFYGQFLNSDFLRSWLPSVAEELAKSEQAMFESPTILLAYGVLAIFCAPWVEEFLFRGLMFRAMRTQWGFWPALLVSTGFFTVLHPVLSWPLVFLVGASCAWLFVKTRSLLPCILLHFVYNLIVVLTSFSG